MWLDLLLDVKKLTGSFQTALKISFFSLTNIKINIKVEFSDSLLSNRMHSIHMQVIYLGLMLQILEYISKCIFCKGHPNFKVNYLYLLMSGENWLTHMIVYSISVFIVFFSYCFPTFSSLFLLLLDKIGTQGEFFNFNTF